MNTLVGLRCSVDGIRFITIRVSKIYINFCVIDGDMNGKDIVDVRENLELYIKMALELVYINDKYLINNFAISEDGKDKKHHVGERAIVFRFAHYLQNIINEDIVLKHYNIDCEFNRHGAERKIVPGYENGIYPDVIIHKRGDDDHNLLVLEFKTYWNNDREGDKKKIAQLMDLSGEYRYKYGASILIGRDIPYIEWLLYKNGQI